MSAPVRSPHSTASSPDEARLRVSLYEQVASLIIALLVLLGVAVLAMFIVVLTMRAFGRFQAVPVTFIDDARGRGDHQAGTERDPENAQVDELDEFFPPEMNEPLETLNTVLSNDVTVLESLDDQLMLSGSNAGKGDSRPPGPMGEGDGDVVPRWERWQVRFASADLNAYAAQLDFFEIELAALGGGKDTVEYASQLSQPTPRRRSGPSAEEKRLYMTWRTGELIEADKSLLAKAGIETAGRVILQLYSAKAEAMLEALETKHAGMRSLKDIKRTVFGIRGSPGKYEFYVISQEYRSI